MKRIAAIAVLMAAIVVAPLLTGGQQERWRGKVAVAKPVLTDAVRSRSRPIPPSLPMSSLSALVSEPWVSSSTSGHRLTTHIVIAPLTVSTGPVSAPASASGAVTATPSAPGWTSNDGTGVTLAQFEGWTTVAICEEGGWVGYSGPSYPDSLGIDATNWWGLGGTGTVTPDHQILIAEQLESTPPYQDTPAGGCQGW